MRKPANPSQSQAHMPTLTGHDACVIMGSDPEALRRLWRRKRGETSLNAEDLLAGELAKASVPANRALFERRTGRKVIAGECRLRHPKLRWMGAIFEGRLEDGALLEAKFAPASMLSVEKARTLFFPLIQHDLWVAQAAEAALSVVTTDGRWFEVVVERDPLFQHLLLTAEKKFLRCLESGEEPDLFLLEAPTTAVEPLTVVDMSHSREWAEAARQFRATAAAHAEHERARQQLAHLLPNDAFRGAAAGVAVERSPFGAVRYSLLAGDARHA